MLATASGFGAESAYPAGVGCGDLQVGDVNGDHKPDVLVSGRNSANGLVSVLLNSGNGTLAEPKITSITVQTSVWPMPAAPVLADFDEDGVVDLVLCDLQHYTLFFAHGNGDGTFGASQSVNSGSRAARTLTAVDLNRDNHLDLVMKGSLSSDVVILFGNGNGTFQAPAALPERGQITSAAVADLNADGIHDLLTVEYDDATSAFLLRIRLGVGNGTFGSPITSFGYSGIGWTAYARDLNGDSRPDIIVVGVSGVSVLLAEGDLTYSPPKFYAANSAQVITLGDFNGDGAVDIASDSSPIAVLYGKPDGTFRAARSYFAGNSGGTAVADLNGDGLPDIVAASSNGAVSLINHADGEFTTIFDKNASGHAGPLFLADFNKDGKLDLVANESSPSGYDTQLGNGDGTFQPRVLGTDCPGDAYGVLAIPADFTSDGNVDLALVGSFSLDVCAGKGDGSFTRSATQRIEFPFMQPAAATTDLDHDGLPDLVAAKSPGIATLLNQGDGTGAMALTNSYTLPNLPIDIAVGDLNGDGNADVVLLDGQLKQVTTMLGDGHGAFGDPIVTSTNFVFRSAGIADLNADGKPDVVLTGGSGVVSVLHGNGDGTLGSESSYIGGSNPATTSFADFNGDGAVDVTFANATSGSPAAGTVTVMLNRGGTKASITSSAEPSQYGQPVTFAVSLTEFVPDSGVPTGTVHLSVGELSSEGNLAAGSYSYTTSALLIGQYSVSASYGGDDTFNRRSVPTITHEVVKADTSVHLASSANPADLGDTVVLSATVSPAYSGTPTGTVTFSDGAAVLGVMPLNGSGTAVFSTSTLSAGTHAIDAAYSGDTNFNGNSATLAQSIRYVTATELSSSTDAQLVGTTLTFTIRVTSPGGTPSGNATLREGSLQLAQGTLINGTTSLQISNLGPGVHVLSASYGGDSMFVSSSSQLTQRVSDFLVEVSPTTRTLNAGQSGTFALTLSPIAGFNGSVSINCSGVPAESTCNVNPTSVSVNGAAATATVTITTTARNRAAVTPFNGNFTYASVLFSSSLGLLGLVFAGPRKNKRSLLVLTVVIAFAFLLASCGGGGGRSSGTPGGTLPTGTPAGTSSLTVNATTTSGSVTVSHSTQFSLIVQ